MYAPPNPRYHTDFKHPGWRGVLAGYALLATGVLSLWAVSNPTAGAVALAAALGLFVGVRRAAALVRCLRVCREFTVDLGGSVRITVTRTSANDAT